MARRGRLVYEGQERNTPFFQLNHDHTCTPVCQCHQCRQLVDEAERRCKSLSSLSPCFLLLVILDGGIFEQSEQDVGCNPFVSSNVCRPGEFQPVVGDLSQGSGGESAIISGA